MHKLSSALLLVALTGCGGASEEADAGRDAGLLARDAFTTTPDAASFDTGPRADAGSMSISGGDVSGDWCGTIEVTGSVTVPLGSTLSLCAGASVRFASGVGMTVNGTLALPGARELPITLDAAERWVGLVVSGTVDGAFVNIAHANQAVDGRAGSVITLNDSTISTSGATLRLANGGTFDRTAIRGGSTVFITGGMLRMSDSILDLEHDTLTPDCTDWTSGGAILDHVRFTGCHCPIHIVHSSLEFTITNSILDGATNPVMIADSVATFTNNDLIGISSLVLDIGAGRSGIECNLAGNYWEGPMGNVAQIGTSNPSQFTGGDVVLAARVPGAGPR